MSDILTCLSELADVALDADARGVPSAATEADLFNALLVLNHIAGSYLYANCDRTSRGALIASNWAEAFGMAVRRACIANLGADPHRLAKGIGAKKN